MPHIKYTQGLSFLFWLLFCCVLQADKITVNNIQPRSLDDYTVEYLEDRGGVSIVNFSGIYDKEINGVANVDARRAVMRELFQHQPDIYDFVVVFTNFAVDTGDSPAFAIPLENTVSGIGIEPFDIRSDFFTTRLQSSIDMGEVSRWELTPINSAYDNTLGILMHEIMHRWGVHVRYMDTNNQLSDKLLGQSNSHWSYFANSHASLMYGALWEESSVGTFNAVDRQAGLSPLDLYLAGFLAPEQVPDFFLITDASAGNADDLPPSIGTTITGTRQNISIDQIIAAEGVRVPSHVDSQKDFNIKFVLLKGVDQPMPDNAIGQLFVLQKELQKRFWAETRGQARLLLPRVSSVENGHPQIVDGSGSSNGGFDLGLALSWLLQQDNNHYWQDKPPSAVRDTAIALQALQLNNNQSLVQQHIDHAINWLNNHQPKNHEERAWLLISGVLTESKRTAIIADLLAAKNNDGGWGLAVMHQSSPYDTALIIRALKTADSQWQMATDTIQYIRQQLDNNAIYGYVEGGQGSLSASAMILPLVQEILPNTDYQQNLIDAMLSGKNSDGSYGENGGTVHETAHVLSAFQQLGQQQLNSEIAETTQALTLMQNTEGALQGSVYATALCMMVVDSQQRPNLRFTGVDGNNLSLVAGEEWSIAVEVENSGDVAVGAFNLNLYRHHPVTQQTELLDGFNYSGLLDTAASLTTGFIVDTSGFTGAETFYLQLDTQNQVVESNEADNQYDLSLQVQVPGQTAELAIRDSSLVLTPTAFDTLPISVELSVEIMNLSTHDTSAIQVHVLETTSNTVLAEQQLDIQAGQSAAVALSALVEQVAVSGEDIQLTLSVDPNNQIAEVNEHNNIRHLSISNQPTIDLSLSADAISVPANPVLGVTVPVEFSFQNLGTQPAPAFSAKVYLNNGSDHVLLYESVIAEMAAGEQQLRTINWVPEVAGNVELVFSLDEDNVVAESNESNNQVTRNITIQPNTLTNLTIDSADINLSAQPALTGQPFTVSVNVRNTSAIDSGPFAVSIYQVIAEADNLLLAEINYDAGVLSGASLQRQWQTNALELVQDSQLLIQVDANQQIAEFNENDNLAFIDIEVNNKPDAAVSAGGFSLSPSTPVAGLPLSVDIQVSNLGGQPLQQLEVSLSGVKASQQAPELIDTIQIPLIAAGQRMPAHFEFSFPQSDGYEQLLVQLDASNQIDEISENNNQAAISIGLQDLRLYVTEQYVSPNGDGIKDNTRIVFNTGVNDQYRIDINDANSERVRSFSGGALDNTDFGDVLWDGRNNQQQLVKDGTYSVHLTGENSGENWSVNIDIDTNRSSLHRSLANHDGHLTELSCLGQFGAMLFSQNGQYLFTRSYRDNSGLNHSGWFRVKSDGSVIRALLSNTFLGRYSINGILRVPDSDRFLIVAADTQDNNRRKYYIIDDNGTLTDVNLSGFDFDSSRVEGIWSDFFVIKTAANQLLRINMYGMADAQVLFDPAVDGYGYLKVEKQLRHGLLIVVRNNISSPSDLVFVSNQNVSLNRLLHNSVVSYQINSAPNGNYVVVKTHDADQPYPYDENLIGQQFIYAADSNQLVTVADQYGYAGGFSPFDEYIFLDETGRLMLLYPSAEKVAITDGAIQSIEDFQQTHIDNYGSLNVPVEFSIDGDSNGYVLYADIRNKSVRYRIENMEWKQDKSLLYLTIQSKLYGEADYTDADGNAGSGYFSFESLSSIRYVKVDYSDINQPLVNRDGNSLSSQRSQNEGHSNYWQSGKRLYSRDIYDSTFIEAPLLNRLRYLGDTVTPDSVNKFAHGINRKTLLYDPALQNETECAEAGERAEYIYQSRDNLYVDLQLESQQNGIAISVTGFDRNFDHFIIESRLSNETENWQILHQGGTSELNGQLVFNWVPENSGVYVLRLTGYDKAGNRISDEERISHQYTAAELADIEVAPTFFSPNGDNRKDTLNINYRVLQATEVLVEIYDESGQLVRFYEREYLTGNVNESIQWDGLNNQGSPVEDGSYRVHIQNHQFDVVLDTVAPEPSIQLKTGAASFGSHYVQQLVIHPGISQNVSLQKFDTNTNTWLDMTSHEIAITAENYRTIASSQFRVVEEDQAGNRGISESAALIGETRLVDIRKNLNQGAQVQTIHATPFQVKMIEEEGVSYYISEPVSMESHPQLISWSTGEELVFVFQQLNDKNFQSIDFTYSYLEFDISTQQNVLIQDSVAVNTLPALELAEYFDGLYESSLGDANNTIVINDGVNETPVFAVKLNRNDFPQTSAKITYNFMFTATDDSEHQVALFIADNDTDSIDESTWLEPSIKLAYGDIHFTPFRFNAVTDIDPRGNAAMWLAEHQSMVELLPQTLNRYYWLTVAGDADIINSMVEVGYSDSLVVRNLLPIYSVSHDDYTSQLFMLENPPCDQAAILKWRGQDSQGNSYPPLTIEESSGLCGDFAIVNEFYLGEPCDNNTPPNGVMRLSNIASELSVDNLPVSVETFVGREVDYTQLINADTNPNIQQSPTYGGSILPGNAYINFFDWDVSALAAGEYIIMTRYVSASGNEKRVWQSVFIDHQAIDFALITPQPQELVCAAGDEQGEILLNLQSSVNSISNYYLGLSLPLDSQLALVGDAHPYRDNYGSYVNANKMVDNAVNFNRDFVLSAPLFSGTQNLLVEGINAAGVSVCQNIEIMVDALVDVQVNGLNSGDIYYLSPNNDSLLDTLEIMQFTAGEPLHAIVQVKDGNNQTTYYQHDLGTFANGQSGSVSWDGTDSNGHVLVDGLYQAEIVFTDNCGVQRSYQYGVVVDTTAPSIAFTAPQANTPVAAMVEIDAVITEPNYQSSQLEYLYNGVWTPIQFDQFSQAGGASLLADWNLGNLPQGNYDLRIIADDLAGNQGQTTITVNYAELQDIFWHFEAAPRFISPNNDQVQDASTLSFGLNMPSTVSMVVVDAADNTIVSLLQQQALAAGSHNIVWGGNAAQSVVADGDYQIQLTAFETANPNNSVSLALTVTVDNTAPQLSWQQLAAGVIKGQGTAGLLIEENYPVQTRVWQQRIEPLGEEQAILNTAASGLFDLFDLSTLSETVYQIRVSSHDLAGNSHQETIRYTIDNTPPLVTIDSMQAQSLLGGAQAQADISGDLQEQHFESLVIAIAAVQPPANSQIIYQTQQAQDIINQRYHYLWPIAISDGAYILTVTATDQAGWVSNSSIELIIDRTAPVADIVQPQNLSSHGQHMVFNGTASDANLAHYTLSYKPVEADENSWQVLALGAENVVNSELAAWQTQVASGQYDIRLLVEDRAQQTATDMIRIDIDTEPPQPATELYAEVVNNQDVQLNWSTSDSTDVAGYHIYRNQQKINNTLVSANTYVDTFVNEGQYSYHVVAVDIHDNNSQPSNTAPVRIDRTAPQVFITQPVNAQTVNGLLEVMGSVENTQDFQRWQSDWRILGANPPGTILRESFLAVTGESLGMINTTELVDGQTYIVRLQATDQTGNSNHTEHLFTVDNQPPQAPLNLSYTLQGVNTVRLSWQAGSEADLAGYVVFRNGLAISGNGIATLAEQIITATSYDDANVVDGTHIYQVAAVDQVGNISAYSNSVSVNIDIGPPDTRIDSPDDGTRFETPLLISASSADTDLARIVFEYSVNGSGQWQLLSDEDTPPYQTTLDAQALGLAFGNVKIRATAHDLAGQIDPTPAHIDIEYADLTAPPAISGLTAQVNGGDIILNWDTNNDIDTSTYVIQRLTEAQWLTIATVASTQNSYTDSGLADGQYSYRIISSDNNDNLSEPMETGPWLVFSIILKQPFSPVLTPQNTIVQGAGLPIGELQAELTNSNGNQTISGITADTNGLFILPEMVLAHDNNQIQVRQRLSPTHVSKTASINVQQSPLPSVPLNAQLNANGFDVNFSWQAGDVQTVAYRIYRNGEPLLSQQPFANINTHTASSNGAGAWQMTDGDNNTYWSPFGSDLTDDQSAWVELLFDQPRWLATSTVHWWQNPGATLAHVPESYQVQYFSAVGWVNVGEYAASDGAEVSAATAVPYLTNRVRIKFSARNDSDIRLAEWHFQHIPFILDPSFTQTVSDGSYGYQVSAINHYGYESALSAVQHIDIGDIVAPETVSLSGQLINQNDVQLSWTASASADVDHYRLLRDDELLLITDDANVLQTVDTGLTNGSYTYRIAAVDAAGNSSVLSNSVEITVAIAALPAPLDLQVTAIPTGGALSISWQPLTHPQLDHYALYRSQQADGPYSLVLTTQQTELTDSGLINGVEYFYQVQAVDTFANVSEFSNRASAIPVDRTPAIPPVILKPTIAGEPITVDQDRIDISGLATPGDRVDIYRNDSYQGTVISSEGLTQSSYLLGNELYDIRISDQSAYMVAENSNSGNTIIMAIGESAGLELTDNLGPLVWNSTGDLLYGLEFDTQVNLVTYNRQGQRQSLVMQASSIEFAIPSPDERYIIYQGSYDDGVAGEQYGLWIYDRQTVSATEVALANVAVNADSVHWLHHSDAVVFVNNSGINGHQLMHYVLDSNTVSLLDEDIYQRSRVDISGDDQYLLYSKYNDQQRLFIYHFGSAQGNPVDAIPAGMRIGWFSPDARQIIYGDCCSVGVIDLPSNEIIISMNDVYTEALYWRADGQAVIAEANRVHLLQAPGVFVYQNLLLESGENRIHAIARDHSDLESEPSEVIRITRSGNSLTDIELLSENIWVTPLNGLTGDTFNASVLITNRSTITAENIQLVALLSHQGTIREITLPQNLQLAAGESYSVNLGLGVLDSAGTYTLQVLADRDNLITESNENNNSGFAGFQVTTDFNPQLGLSLLTPSVAPGNNALARLQVFNPGSVFNGSAHVRIIDSAGFPVGFDDNLDINALVNNATYEHTINWSTANVFAGQYDIIVTLLADNGSQIDQQQVTVAVAAEANFSLQLNVAQSQQPPDQPFNLTAEMAYLDGNVPQNGQLDWVITDSNQHVLWSAHTPLDNLLPTYTASFQQDWSYPIAGNYRVQVTLSTPLQVRTAELPLVVVATTATVDLQGIIDAQPANLILGQGAVISYQLSNHGTQDLVAMPINIRLLSADLTTVIQEQHNNENIAAGTTVNRQMAIDTQNLLMDNYVAVLQADLTASGGDSSQLLDTRAIGAVDALPPVIDILSPAAGSWVSHSAVLRLQVNDQHSAINNVTVSLPAAGTIPLGSSGFGGSYQYVIDNLTEGEQTLTIEASDMAGNTSTSLHTFFVDNTAPHIDISGVQANGLYTQAVVPVISISENNLDTRNITLNGNAFQSGSSIQADGVYFLQVSATDLAGNRSDQSLSFVIDTSPPLTTITFPADGSQTTSADTAISGQTELLAQVTLTINGEQTLVQADDNGLFTLPAVPLLIGHNSITAEARDAAGNNGAADTISIQRLGETAISGSISTAPQSPAGADMTVDYQLNNTSSDTITAMPVRIDLVDVDNNSVIDSQAFSVDIDANDSISNSLLFSAANLPVQSYRYELYATTNQQPQLLANTSVDIVDQTAPALTVISPQADGVYNQQLLLSVNATDAHSAIQQVEYRIDNAAWLPMIANGNHYDATVNLADGSHNVAFRATDTAANTASPVRLDFVVDTQAPQIHIASPANGLISNQDITVNFTVTDAHAVNTEALLNGNSIANGAVFTEEGNHTLAITATDSVNNMASLQHQFIIDKTAPPIAISYPADQAELNGLQTSLNGHTEANLLVQLQTGSYQAQVMADNTGNYSFTNVALSAGDNIISVTATDQAGNISQPATVQVTATAKLQLTATISHPPQVELGSNWQANYQISNAADSALDNTDVRLQLLDASSQPLATINNQLNIAANGTTSSQAVLTTAGAAVGVYTLQLQVNSQQQWHTLASSTVRFVDSTAPPLLISSPQPDQLVQTDHINISGSSEQGATIRVNLNGTTISQTIHQGDLFTFNNVAVVAGENHLQAIAEDIYGNQSQPVNRRFHAVQGNQVNGTLNNIPDLLDNQSELVFSYRLDSITNISQLAITVDIVHTPTATVVYQHQNTIHLLAGQPFEQSINARTDGWQPGSHQVRLSAGVQTEPLLQLLDQAQLTIEAANGTLELRVISPLPEQNISGNNTGLRGEASVGADIVVSNQNWIPAGSNQPWQQTTQADLQGRFAVSSVPLQQGLNRLVVTATLNGQTRTVSLSVYGTQVMVPVNSLWYLWLLILMIVGMGHRFLATQGQGEKS